jgi:hypothetical protein
VQTVDDEVVEVQFGERLDGVRISEGDPWTGGDRTLGENSP